MSQHVLDPASVAEAEMAATARACLVSALDHSKAEQIKVTIDIGEVGSDMPVLTVPPRALRFFADVLRQMAKREPMLLVPQKTQDEELARTSPGRRLEGGSEMAHGMKVMGAIEHDRLAAAQKHLETRRPPCLSHAAFKRGQGDIEPGFAKALDGRLDERRVAGLTDPQKSQSKPTTSRISHYLAAAPPIHLFNLPCGVFGQG